MEELQIKTQPQQFYKLNTSKPYSAVTTEKGHIYNCIVYLVVGVVFIILEVLELLGFTFS